MCAGCHDSPDVGQAFKHEEAQSDVVNDYPLCVQDGMAALVLADHSAHEEAQADVVFV